MQNPSALEGFRSSPQQQRLLAGSTTQTLPALCRLGVKINGAIDPAILENAADQVACRYEIFRTRLRQLPGMTFPLQVLEQSRPALTFNARSTTANEADILKSFIDHIESPATDANCTLQLLSLSATQHLLLLEMPSVYGDLYTLQQFARELRDSYCKKHPRDESPLAYIDVAEWLQEMAQNDEGKAFWRTFKAPTTTLPANIRGAAAGWRRLEVILPEPLTTQRINAALPGRAYGSVKAADLLFLTCWCLLLGRYSGETRISLGYHSDGRDAEALAGVLGPLTRALPIGVCVDHNRSLKQTVADLEATLQAALEWQYCYPDAGQSLGPVGFSSIVYHWGRDAGASWCPLGGVDCVAGHDLQLTLIHSEDDSNTDCENDLNAIQLVYNSARYSHAHIKRLASQLITLTCSAVETAVGNQHAPVGQLSWLPDDQRQQLLGDFNNGRNNSLNNSHNNSHNENLCQPQASLHQLFERQAELTPERVALQSGHRRLSYRQLNDAANALAERLHCPRYQEIFIGLYCERSIEAVVAMLAVLKAGAAYVPLDPQYPHQRLANMIDSCAITLVLTTRALAAELAPAEETLNGGAGVHSFVTLLIDADSDGDRHSDGDFDSAAPACVRRQRNTPDNRAAYVIFTSGSSGRPKPVVVEHRQAVNHMHWMLAHYPLGGGDRCLQRTALGFDASVWEIFCPLASGASLIIAAAESGGDIASLIDLLDREHITQMQLVPSLLRALLQNRVFVEHPTLKGRLKRVFCGGEPLEQSLAAAFANKIPGAALINLYGPTECTIDVTHWPLPKNTPEPGRENAAIAPIGKPISGARLYILDRHLAPVPIGVQGEIYIAGAPVARGYHGQPALTAAAFLPDPYCSQPGQRMYRSGDLGRWDEDGAVEICGRRDRQIKLRGQRLELDEVEAVTRQHPALAEAAVIDKTDADGRPEQLYCFYLESTRTAASAEQDNATAARPLTETELRGFLAARLPAYMIPSRFIRLTELPKNTAGKIDRQRLRDIDPESNPSPRSIVPPRDALERQLLAIWKQLLGRDDVGVTDNFFEIGGHSLIAINLIHTLQQTLDCDLPLGSILEAPTVAQQARLIDTGSATSPLVCLQKGAADKTPLFLIHPTGGNVVCYAGLAQELESEQPVYALQDNGTGIGLSLPALAARYIEELRRIQPRGPYQLGGWSFGGVLAYEIAQQLQRKHNQPIALVAMFDSCAANGHSGENRNRQAQHHLPLSVARLLAYLSQRELQAVELARLKDPHQALALLRELAIESAFVPPQTPVARIARLLDVFRAHVQALNAYRCQPCHFPIHLFKADKALPPALREAAQQDFTESPGNGWENLGKLRVHRSGGNHLSILTGAHAAAVATTLLRLMEVRQSVAKATPD